MLLVILSPMNIFRECFLVTREELRVKPLRAHLHCLGTPPRALQQNGPSPPGVRHLPTSMEHACSCVGVNLQVSVFTAIAGGREQVGYGSLVPSLQEHRHTPKAVIPKQGIMTE